MEFLKAHAILSRSWLLAALTEKEKTEDRPGTRASTIEDEEEVRALVRPGGTRPLRRLCR